MNFLTHKVWISFLVSLPFFWLVTLGLSEGLGANPIEFLTLETGNWGLKLLVGVLLISPLQSLFPAQSWVKKLTKIRRPLGVGCFFYLCLHFMIYILDHMFRPYVLLEDLIKPFSAFGLSAFLLLLPLAVTSNNYSIKKLRFPRWKKLHRLVYPAAFLVLFHLILKEKAQYITAIQYFIPLILAELIRVVLWKIRSKKKSPTP